MEVLALELVFLAAPALVACQTHQSDGELKRYRCTCAFLTDTDGAGSLEIELCTAANRDAKAKGCAQTAAPATVERCDCQASDGACDVDLCTVIER